VYLINKIAVNMQSQNNQNSFKKGQSGNPSGRPKKSTQEKLESMINKNSSKTINAINKAIKNNEPWAIELCFKELAKKSDREFEIPTLN
jgi:hypothetical protein